MHMHDWRVVSVSQATVEKGFPVGRWVLFSRWHTGTNVKFECKVCGKVTRKYATKRCRP